jgi:hypothetical protein
MPFFNDIQISPFNLDLNSKDFMYGGWAGIKDLRYKISLNIGFNTRLWPKRVLIPIDDNTFYQFWEKRSTLNLGIQKNIGLPINSFYQQEISVCINEVYTYGKYNSAITKPKNKFLLAPEIGYTAFHQGLGTKISIEYLNLKIKDISPVRINVGFYFNIKRKKYIPAMKDIDWL